MESAGESRGARSPEITEHGLKSNAIGFRDALIIGIASTAPAYSLAAVIGLVVVTVGVQAPAVLLADPDGPLAPRRPRELLRGRTPETVDPEVAEGWVRVQETAGAPPESR